MRFYLVFFALFSLAGNALAQMELQGHLNALAADPQLKGAELSVSVIDIATNQLVASHESRKALIPASSLKLLTTATALALLGPEHRFYTDLQYDGYIDAEGILNGNIYITGYGDPTLGSDQMDGVDSMDKVLEKWLSAIKEAGIKSIQGAILADDTYFEDTPVSPNWSWSDIGNYYGAGAWALNVHENFYYLRFQQNRNPGSKPSLKGTVPKIEGLNFENDVVTAGAHTGDNAYIYGRVYTYVREVSGSIPAGNGLFVIKGSMPDPPFFIAQSFQNKLQDAGIGCSLSCGKVKRQVHKEARNLLIRLYSPTLKQIVVRTNLESVNVYSEVLLRIIGKHLLGTGSREAGIMAIRQVWEDRGLSWTETTLDDGCGLSSLNRISSLQLAGTIRKAWIDENLRPALKASLPLAGVSGTMRSYLKGTVAEGKLQAKTGSMNGVRSFTGIATNRKGQQFAFSIIVNHYSCTNSQIRKKLETFLLHLCE
ncbi:MAG: D-alanyl-D-alanine carboxypeptidase/D-alanyl-D-alanine-endopeptidase [Saprospiraceae bacterium]|nr:D-alanyl-D-alanine carboxypeptidase/D-alanyl-D-alanine-endopeptidase [Saprospiraceae bacterium]